MVFQTYALYPHMTVERNMGFGLLMNGMPKAEVKTPRRRGGADPAARADYLDRKPKALSGGQRQRVAIGRAIVRDPEVFLFDEPLSNLDAELRVATRLEIAKLHSQLDGSTMIYVTHDQVEAMTLADRIVVLRDGRVEQVGAPMELYEQPGQPVRRRLHRQPEDELHRAEAAAPAPPNCPTAARLALAGDAARAATLGVRARRAAARRPAAPRSAAR